jgi:phosphoribosylformimino-5-aminoimidazole carboxamide ribotide isomerase
MRLIPVIDLIDGQAVHAVKGVRAQYRPVKSVLCRTSDPVTVARAFRDRLRLDEIYVADLDAIRGFANTAHREVIEALIRREAMHLILDAGVSDVASVRAWLDLGVHKIVIASETLRWWDELRRIPAAIDRDRLVFSLDFRAGKILSQCPHLAAMPPMKALEQLQSSAWQEILLLDLSRVGSRWGADRALAAEARASFPDLSLLIGGGIDTPQELIDLRSLGVAGVLVATALHCGTLCAEDISSLGVLK